MFYLYLDESGDLGFDFVNKKPSKFFTVAVLVIKGQENNRALINAIKHTLKRKLKKKKLFKNSSFELKGCKVAFEVKKYFYFKVKDLDFNLYALTLNKKRLYPSLMKEKERVYNYIAGLVIKKIEFENAKTRVEFIVDKSKGKPEIEDFNSYVFNHIQAKLNPNIPLNIKHSLSHENLGLQAVDMFAWGIFRKYEKKDFEWFNTYKDKVSFDDVYLP